MMTSQDFDTLADHLASARLLLTARTSSDDAAVVNLQTNAFDKAVEAVADACTGRNKSFDRLRFMLRVRPNVFVRSRDANGTLVGIDLLPYERSCVAIALDRHLAEGPVPTNDNLNFFTRSAAIQALEYGLKAHQFTPEGEKHAQAALAKIKAAS